MLVAALSAWLATPCLATDVQVIGVTPGRSAVVVIDGGAPITLAIGDVPVERVVVLAADRGGATLDVDGVEQTVPLTALRTASPAARRDTVALAADAQGHFVTEASVNGRPARFVVDTGATLTTLSRAEAKRLGLDYRRGTPQQIMTANGLASGWRMALDTVTIGGATARNIDAMVLDSDALPIGLLGMSFLGRFDMQHTGLDARAASALTRAGNLRVRPACQALASAG